MKIRGYLFLTMLFLSPCSLAETWGNPKFEEQQLSLTHRGPVAQEIMVNQVLNLIGNKFTGTVRLSWADDGFADTARQLRAALIQKGVAPDRVLLSRESGGYQANAVAGVEVRIRRIVLRLPECDYASQNYRFKNNAPMGCALNNTRNSAIINLNDYFF